MPELEFHFDFLSPYGYFASLSVEEIAARHNRVVSWCPMLLGVTVMKVMGLKPLPETPLKGPYVLRDVARTARQLKLQIGRDLKKPPSNSLVPARALCWAKVHSPEAVPGLARAFYSAIWARGVDIDKPEDLATVPLPREIAAPELIAAAKGQEAASLLRGSVEESIKKGVFGSPTFIVDGETFWGFDHLGQVDEWLATGGW